MGKEKQKITLDEMKALLRKFEKRHGHTIAFVGLGAFGPGHDWDEDEDLEFTKRLLNQINRLLGKKERADG
jgi:hypothetical protein